MKDPAKLGTTIIVDFDKNTIEKNNIDLRTE